MANRLYYRITYRAHYLDAYIRTAWMSVKEYREFIKVLDNEKVKYKTPETRRS